MFCFMGNHHLCFRYNCTDHQEKKKDYLDDSKLYIFPDSLSCCNAFSISFLTIFADFVDVVLTL